MAESKSIADHLNEAWDKAEGTEAAETGEAPAEVAETTEAEASVDSGNEAPTEEASAEPAQEQTAAPEPTQQGQKKTVTPKPGKGQKGAASATPAPAATPESGPKAPQSWPAPIREHWKNLPPEVKAQVDKTEREVRRVLQETAGARKVAAELERTLAPYKPFMAGPPLKEVDGLFRTVVALRTGDDDTRAAIAANIIANFRVPVDKVADILEGKSGGAKSGHGSAPAPQQSPQAAPQAPQDFRDTRFDQFMGTLQQHAQMTAMARKQKQREELEAFANSGKAEFFYDVLPQMEAIQQVAAASGENLSIDELYERACFVNKSVRPLWEQRRAATQAAANASRASTQPRTRVATSSLRHEPTAPTNGARPLSRREQLEAAWAKSEAKR